MNKQELIERIGKLPYVEGLIVDTVTVNRSWILESIEQLDEPQEVPVPQFVADWYEEHKDNLEYNIWDWMKYNLEPKKRENKTFSQWLGKTVNKPVETLIKMKLYGYTVEKEKRYRVKLKNADISYSLLKRNTEGEWWFGIDFDGESHAHTRKELEEAGFGDVFDSPLFEVEEVEG